MWDKNSDEQHAHHSLDKNWIKNIETISLKLTCRGRKGTNLQGKLPHQVMSHINLYSLCSHKCNGIPWALRPLVLISCLCLKTLIKDPHVQYQPNLFSVIYSVTTWWWKSCTGGCLKCLISIVQSNYTTNMCVNQGGEVSTGKCFVWPFFWSFLICDKSMRIDRTIHELFGVSLTTDRGKYSQLVTSFSEGSITFLLTST